MKYFAFGVPVTVLIVLLSVIQPEALIEFTVGGHLGWRVPNSNDTEMFNHWAETRRFHVGDTLRFVYTNDSVLEVDKYDYYHCKIAAPLATYTNSNTRVKLIRTGFNYYISGVADRCVEGQRVIIDVMSLHAHVLSPPRSDDGHQPASAPQSHVSSAAALLSTSTTVVSALAAAVVMGVSACSLFTVC